MSNTAEETSASCPETGYEDGRYVHGLCVDFLSQSPERIKLIRTWEYLKQIDSHTGNSSGVDFYKNTDVDAVWSTSFEAFEGWSLANGFQLDRALTRLDHGQGFNPQNCAWRRATNCKAVVSEKGECFPSAKDAAEFLDVSYHGFSKALRLQRPYKGTQWRYAHP